MVECRVLFKIEFGVAVFNLETNKKMRILDEDMFNNYEFGDHILVENRVMIENITRNQKQRSDIPLSKNVDIDFVTKRVQVANIENGTIEFRLPIKDTPNIRVKYKDNRGFDNLVKNQILYIVNFTPLKYDHQNDTPYLASMEYLKSNAGKLMLDNR